MDIVTHIVMVLARTRDKRRDDTHPRIKRQHNKHEKSDTNERIIMER